MNGAENNIESAGRTVTVGATRHGVRDAHTVLVEDSVAAIDDAGLVLEVRVVIEVVVELEVAVDEALAAEESIAADVAAFMAVDEALLNLEDKPKADEVAAIVAEEVRYIDSNAVALTEAELLTELSVEVETDGDVVTFSVAEMLVETL